MKVTRKLTALLTILALLSTLWVPAAVSAEATEPQEESLFYFGRSALADMKNGAALCYAYDRLVAGCETTSDYIDIYHRTHRINSDEAFIVWETVMNDHPEFFWLSDGMSLWGSDKQITAFAPYIYDGIAEERVALNARVQELTADLKGKSDYEKSLILHDRIVNTVTYRNNAYDQNVIGALLHGQAVCAGYSRAYQLLLQTVGIPSHVVTGYSLGQNHAWNLVQLDGDWYYTDVTWDDQTDTDGHIFYAYLNLPYEWMNLDHTAVSLAEYLPRSTATANNYHVKNGTVMETPDVDAIIALYRAGKTVRLYITGDIGTFFDQLSAAVPTIMTAIACPYSGYSWGTSHMGREAILLLLISDPHVYPGDSNTCSNCGYVQKENHHYVASVPDATCSQEGKVVYTCSYCGDSYTEIIPVAEHRPVTVPGYAPTCTQEGLSEGSICGDCGATIQAQNTIPAIGHNYAEEILAEPTCVTEGTVQYTCTICGHAYTDTIPAAEHTPVTITGYAPTCNEYGLSDGSRCDTCGAILAEQEILPSTGHTYATEVTAPDCIHGGYTTYTCIDCDDVWVGDHIDPLDHVYDGDTDADCNRCGEVREVTVVGDADGNGKVNNRDLGLLQRYLNGNAVTIDQVAIDMDGNGKINNRDLGLLQKLLNN